MMVAIGIEVIEVEGPLCSEVLGLCTKQCRGELPLNLSLTVGGWEDRPSEIPLVKGLGKGPWGGGESGDVEKETTLA